MTTPPSPTVAPAKGRLGVLTVGLGAVASTLIAGVELVKRGMSARSARSPRWAPSASASAPRTAARSSRTSCRSPTLDDIVFGAWDPFPDDAYVAATRAGVLEGGKHIEGIAEALRDVRPMPAAFDREYVKRIDADNTMHTINKRGDAQRHPRGHQPLQGGEAGRPPRHAVGGEHRDLHRARPGAPGPRGVRSGDRRQRPDDRAVDALRLRRDPGGRAVRQRRAEPHGRHPGAARAGHRAARCRSAARTSRPARR